MLKQWIEGRWSAIEKILYLLVFLGLVLAAFLLGGRAVLEKNDRQVDLALDYGALIKESRLAGLSLEESLKTYRNQGATSLFVKERNLADLIASQEVYRGQTLIKEGLAVQKTSDYIATDDPKLAADLALNLNCRGVYTGQIKEGSTSYIGSSLPLKEAGLLAEKERLELLSYGLGWPLEDMKLAQSLGYMLQIQIKDWPRPEVGQLEDYFQQFPSDLDFSLISFNSPDIFSLSQMQNKDKIIHTLAGEMANLDAPLGQFEFYEQKGFEGLAQGYDNRVVRVHSIPQDEMSLMSQKEALARFRLAVKDRGMRSLYVRPLVEPSPFSPAPNADYMAELSGQLEAAGFNIGPASTPPALGLAGWQALALAGSVLSAGILLLRRLGLKGLAGLALPLAPLFLVFSYLFLAADHFYLFLKAYALLAALIFPSLALILTVQAPFQPGRLLASLGKVLQCSLLSLLGGLMVAGLLRDRVFILGLDGFVGVKLAHLIPLALVAAYLIWQGQFASRPVPGSAQTWTLSAEDRIRKDASSRGRPSLKASIIKIYEKPLTLGLFFLFIIVALALLVYLLRTGNQGASLSSLEESMRYFLETVLGARPRTKEFLIGYPLLVLAFYWADRPGSWLLFTLGMISQVSLVNTFAHIHSPLYLGLLRSAYGLILGLILGLLLLKLVDYLGHRWEKLP